MVHLVFQFIVKVYSLIDYLVYLFFVLCRVEADEKSTVIQKFFDKELDVFFNCSKVHDIRNYLLSVCQA